MVQEAQRFGNFRGEYLGGHSMYSNRQSISLSLSTDEILVAGLDLQIPYSTIKEVKNITKNSSKALKVLAFGLMGAFMNETETYLCLVYNDGKLDQNPVFKLDRLDLAQRAIHMNIMQFQKAISPKQQIPSEVKVKEIIKETQVIVKIRCSYCKNVYDETLDKCPHCGARST
jgi:hypothetical protein